MNGKQTNGMLRLVQITVYSKRLKVELNTCGLNYIVFDDDTYH